MASQLQDFYQSIIKNGVRYNYQYKMNLLIDDATLQQSLKDLVFYAQSSTIPGKTVQASDLAFLGSTFKCPSSFSLSHEIRLRINCDENMVIREAFEKLNDQFSSFINGGTGDMTLPGEDTNKITLDLYSSDLSSIIKSYDLKGIWVSSLTDIEQSQGGTEITTFEATVIYQWFEVVQKKTSTTALQSKQQLKGTEMAGEPLSQSNVG